MTLKLSLMMIVMLALGVRTWQDLDLPDQCCAELWWPGRAWIWLTSIKQRWFTAKEADDCSQQLCEAVVSLVMHFVYYVMHHCVSCNSPCVLCNAVIIGLFKGLDLFYLDPSNYSLMYLYCALKYMMLSWDMFWLLDSETGRELTLELRTHRAKTCQFQLY